VGFTTFGFVFSQDIWLKVFMGLWAFVYDVWFRVFDLGCSSTFWLRTIGFVFLQDIGLRCSWDFGPLCMMFSLGFLA
jgi:hypothetical protein